MALGPLDGPDPLDEDEKSGKNKTPSKPQPSEPEKETD